MGTLNRNGETSEQAAVCLIQRKIRITSLSCLSVIVSIVSVLAAQNPEVSGSYVEQLTNNITNTSGL